MIEKVKGIKITIKKAAALVAKSVSSKFILPSSVNINTPTTTNTGYIAFEGIDLKSGNIKRVVINNKAVKTAVNPVLPPSSTPLALSINAVVVETPNKLPPTVAIASASSVFCNDLSFLLFS